MKKPSNYDLRPAKSNVKTAALQSTSKIITSGVTSTEQSRLMQYDKSMPIQPMRRRDTTSQKRPNSSQPYSKTSKLTHDYSSTKDLLSLKSTSKRALNSASYFTSHSKNRRNSKQPVVDFEPAKRHVVLGQRKNSTFSQNNMLSMIRKSKESYESDDNQDYKSMFTSPPQLLSNQKQKSKRARKDNFMSDDKENQQINSNHKKPHLLAQTSKETLLTENLIQKLKQEVQKQVKIRETQTKVDDAQKTKLKQYQQSLKHIASVIPYDQRERMRQKKAIQQQNQYEMLLVKQKQEYEEKSKQRLQIKKKRDNERKENRVFLKMLKQSMSNSPQRRRNDNQFKRDNTYDVKIESVDEFEKRIVLHRQSSDDDEDPDDLDRIMSHTQSQQEFHSVPYSEEEDRVMKPVLHNPKHQQHKNSKSPKKDSPVRVFDWRAKLMERPVTKSPQSDNKSAEKEYRHQQLDNYLREQKIKRQQEKIQKDAIETKKFTKLKSQLKGLQRDYYKGLEEFKSKQQRAVSEKRMTEPKKKLKRKKKIIKRQSSMPKTLHLQKHEYDLINQRKSMPQLLQSPFAKEKINMQSRASFQSPQHLLRPMTTYEHFNPMQSDDAQSCLTSQSPSQKTLYADQYGQPIMIRESLTSLQTINTMSSVPKKIDKQIISINQYKNQQKKCTLFPNNSMKSLQDMQHSQSQSSLPIKQDKNSILDMKSDKTHQMFQEFAQVRKTLELQLKVKKNRVMEYPLQTTQNRKSSKKRSKIQNLPFKAQHIQHQNFISSPSYDQLPQPVLQNPADLEIAKQHLMQKLQQVANRVQNQYKKQASKYKDSSLVNSPYPKEEYKETELTTYLSPERKSPEFLISEPVTTSKIEDSKHQIISSNRITKRTVSKAALVSAAIKIQKHYRGYKCRKILKEKLRIDREFRMLRQKYEVKSNASSSKTLLSSLAFSQSKPFKFTQKEIQQIEHQVQPILHDNILAQSLPIRQEKIFQYDNPSSYNQQTIDQNEAQKRQSEQFYKQDDGAQSNQQHFYASVFKSPSIEEAIMSSQQQVDSECKPTKLQFQDSQMQPNLLKDSEISVLPMRRPEVRKEIIIQDQLLEEFKDQSFINEDESQRSQNPIDDQTPFTLKQQQKLPYKNTQLAINTEQANQENEDSNIIRQQFLDSPLKINDLSATEDQKSRSSQQIKRNLPRPISKNEEVKRPTSQNKPRGISPINSKSPQSQLFQQRSSFDISSLINYGEEEKPQSIKQQLPNDENYFPVEGSPLVVEEDISPSNITRTFSNKLGKKDDSINTSIFEKNSFQQFAKDRVNKVFKAEAQIEQMIEDLNKALKKKIKIRHQELQDQNLSMRTYNRKKVELEKWVDKEKREIKMTKRHFMQGCMRLSSLLDHFVKEQGRMKDAVSSIRKQAQQNTNTVRRSHSFDSEIQKQYKELQSNLFNSNNNISGEYNTVSGRRLSGVYNQSFQQSEKTKEEIKKDNESVDEKLIKKQTFEYQPMVSLAQVNESKPEEEEIKVDDSSEQLIEVKQNADQQTSLQQDNILIETCDEAIKSKRQSIDEFSNLDDLSQSKELPNPHSQVDIPFEDNLLKLSDTPLLTKDIKFPEDVSSLEDYEREQSVKVERMVDEIFHEFLFRETRDRLFPPRPLAKLQQQQRSETEKSPPKEQFEDQIKVLDNIIDECQNEEKEVLDEEVKDEPVTTDEIQLNIVEADDPKKKGIDSGIMQVNQYMQEIFQKIKTDQYAMGGVLDNVSQPLYKDPVLILAHLQNSFPEPPVTTETDDQINPIAYESPMPFQQSVLSVDLYLDIEKERRGGLSISQMKDSFQESNSQSFVNEMENIHNKAIFDAVNEALDGFRPYGLRGPPLPWSKQSKTLTFKYGKEETLEYLLQKVKYKVLEWAHINAGALGRPNLSPRSKDRLELIREDKLAKILIAEADENEPIWTDYEYEETQTKLDIADLILDHLCKETVDIINEIQSKKEM